MKEECSIMYSGFVQVTLGSNAAADTFEIGPGSPTKTDRGAASAGQSILSRHLLGLAESADIDLQFSRHSELMKGDKHSNLPAVSAPTVY